MELALLEGGQELPPRDPKGASFIQELGEARMFKTRDQIGKEGARVISDHMFISLLALFAMSNDYRYAPVASEYAKRTMRMGNFNRPSPSGTDLYQTVHSLLKPGDMFNSDRDALLTNNIRIDQNRLKRFLNDIKSGRTDGPGIGQYLYKLERDLRIQDPKLRAARRLIQDWPRLTTQQQQLAVTQLMKHFRLHGRRSDIMPLFMQFAKDGNFELSSGKLQKIAKKAAEYAAIAGVGYLAGKNIGI